MEILYCEKCGMRVAEADLQTGKATFDGVIAYCPKCAPAAAAGAAGPGPASGKRPATGARPRPATRHQARAPRPAAGSPVPLAAVAVVAAVAGLAAAYFLLGRSGPPPERRRPPEKERSAPPAPDVGTPAKPPEKEPEQERRYGLQAMEEVEIPRETSVPRPTPAPRPAPAPAPRPEGDKLPAPPAPFAIPAGEKLLYGWDYRAPPTGLGGGRLEVSPGVTVQAGNPKCSNGWSARPHFVVPARGVIRARLLITGGSQLNMVIVMMGNKTQHHTFYGLQPGKWCDAVVEMDKMRAWSRTASLKQVPPDSQVREIVLYFDGDTGARMYCSEIKVSAVE